MWLMIVCLYMDSMDICDVSAEVHPGVYLCFVYEEPMDPIDSR